MGLGLYQMLTPPQQDQIERYDALVQESRLPKTSPYHVSLFDGKPRRKPYNYSYKYWDQYAQHEGFGPGHAAPVAEAVVLAHQNLKLRGLVGLVLGSSIRDLTDPPSYPGDLNVHRDFDVLVLNSHSTNSPAPTEWGIDWFVRPRTLPSTVYAPTNGRVWVWYDVGLSEGVKVSSPLQTPGIATGYNENPYYTEEEVNRYWLFDQVDYSPHPIPSSLRSTLYKKRKAYAIHVPAGLYLPDARMTQRIAQYCNQRIQRVLHEDLPRIQKDVARFDSIDWYDHMAHLLSQFSRSEWRSPLFRESLKRSMPLLEGTIHRINGLLHQLSVDQAEFIRDSRTFEMQMLSAFHTSYDAYPQFDIVLELSDRLNTLERRAMELDRDYSYIALESDDLQNRSVPLLPVLPSELLTFNGLS